MEFIDIPTPSIPVPGQGVTADRGAGDARAMRALRIIPGRGIRATATPDGVVVSATGGGAPAPAAAAGAELGVADVTLSGGGVEASESRTLDGASAFPVGDGCFPLRFTDDGGGTTYGPVRTILFPYRRLMAIRHSLGD